MEQSPHTTKKKASLRARFSTFLVLWKELKRDPQAFNTLIACTLAMVTAGLEPAFLTLSTPEIQNQLRSLGSHAPMYIAFGFLLLAVLTLIAGTSGDLFGRKLILVSALIGLTLANLFGALSFGTPQFIITDLIGTITAAALMPMCVALVTFAFPLGTRPLAFAFMFGLSCVAPITGAMLGGLCEMWGIPRAAFIPVVITGFLAIWLVTRNVSESHAAKGFRRTSAVINLLLLVNIFIFVYLVLAAPKSLLSWLPVFVAGIGLLIFVLCVRWLRKRVSFFRGVEMFTGADTGLSIFAGLVLFMGQGALFYQLSAFFQKIQNMNSVQAGLAFAPFVLGILVGSALIPFLAMRIGARRIIVIGLFGMGISMLWISFIWVDTSYWFLVTPLLLAGIGFGTASPARTQVVLAAPPPDLTGSAAAVNTAVGLSGYALGVILSSIIISFKANTALVELLTQMGVTEKTLQQIQSALPGILDQTASGEYPNLPQAVLDLAHATFAQILTTSMGQMFMILAITSFVAVVIIYIGMRRGLRIGGAPLPHPNSPVDGNLVSRENDGTSHL
jgi:MFS family permease